MVVYKSHLKNGEQRLTDKRVLKLLDVNKKNMNQLLVQCNWKNSFNDLIEKGDFSALSLLEKLRPAMDALGDEPDDGWLRYIADSIRNSLYPDGTIFTEDEGCIKARHFFMENYRLLLECEEDVKGFCPTDHIHLLRREEVKGSTTSREYEILRRFWVKNHIYEYMRLNREISPFNTVGHTGGVHYVAMHIGKQMECTDIPIDMALLSGAAVCHDIGKFGCSGCEAKRIPYLHYYYTDELLKREKMFMIAHIASNHSTWDLELENLSVESLLLIYADFRVKSKYPEGAEEIHFYSLEEAFDVILNKLDDVDERKRRRYIKVYNKLKDFENYMINQGIETDVFKAPGQDIGRLRKDNALLMGEEVVEGLKYAAIEHNIKLMSIFNNEASFVSLLEAARSEQQWKSQRTYLNIFAEYYNYMTKQEKMLTIHFLYELLSHREGDIRRQAGKLLGTVIANYDDVYRKELPDGVADKLDHEAYEIWKMYLHKIVFPDYKVTEQHRSWIGYTLKIVLQGVIENTDDGSGRKFMSEYFRLFRNSGIENSAVFVLLDSLISVPLNMFRKDDMEYAVKFAAEVSVRESAEIKIGALRAAGYIVRNMLSDNIMEYAEDILGNCEEVTDNVSVAYLAWKVCQGIGDDARAKIYEDKFTNYRQADVEGEDAISIMFRENLKVGTPWVVKIVNIDFLLRQSLSGYLSNHKFHLATHLSNLLKVSERVTVRHRAGSGLIDIAETLPIEQLNEIVIELTKGLEIGEYQFSKYIPEYLGKISLLLYPVELDEFIGNLEELLESTNDRIASVALDTIGEMIENYSAYKFMGEEDDEEYENRKTRMLGMLLRGFANYQETVSQEAFMVMGQRIFGSSKLSKIEKFDAFSHLYKKIITLMGSNRDYDMNFYTNAAALNHIYRFISDYKFCMKEMKLAENKQIAFFPGTFDPFSLSHKGIVQAVRKLGFEVYLALDEFSWSKNTQPQKIRRKIVNISVADEPDVYMFPEDVPVNIANPNDLKRLRNLFPGREVYMVAGSDVVINASSYKANPADGSIHSMNHIVFRRETLTDSQGDRKALDAAYGRITGKIKELKLPVYLEDISSTRIRENIDHGRDIAKLIDITAQNYIYDNGLYLREPQYKNIFEIKNISYERLTDTDCKEMQDLRRDMKSKGVNIRSLDLYLEKSNVRISVIKDGAKRICALAAVNELETGRLYEAFHDIEIAAYLRHKATGRMLVIREIYCIDIPEVRNLMQVMMTEVLSEAVAGDITYAIYHPIDGRRDNKVKDVLIRQGFTEIKIKNKPQGIYEVNMKEPIAVLKNMDTVLKSPLNRNPRILNILEKTHGDMQLALTKLNPGNLVLSFNAGIMHQKIVKMVTRSNRVPNYPLENRVLGECMCVPFGKIMRGKAVPNTVTKSLHTEKVFTSCLDSFKIEEFPMYTTLPNQIRTIKSFGRPIILVDDILHKGYRIKALDPMFKENDLEIRELITGILSGRGRDLMAVQGREVESAYFIPNLKYWFVESSMYPYIGGDGIESENETEYSLINSINLLLPFAAPKFLNGAPKDAIYNLSEVCIKNAEKIFIVLEEEYRKVFERQLTIKRLSDAVFSPRMPNGSARVFVDVNLSPSVYMADYLERLARIESVWK